MGIVSKSINALALLYSMAFFPAPLFWLVIHGGIRFWRRLGHRSFWVTLPLWIACDTALFLARHWILGERFERNVVTWTFGLALIAAALALGHTVYRDFGLRRLAGLPEISPGRYPDAMVTSGIYSSIRHPRYLEYMLTFFGLGLLTGAKGVFLLAIMTVLLYLIVTPLEERELREHYGESYEAYARAVPRFVPRLRRHSWDRT
jgi:protein-S-isoprenylcysteine O-methyltransferase Ste14